MQSKAGKKKWGIRKTLMGNQKDQKKQLRIDLLFAGNFLPALL